MIPQIHFYNEAIEIFTRNGLFDTELKTLCELALSLANSKSLNVCEILLDCVLVTIFVDKPICDIFDLNFELAGILVESLSDVRSDILMIEYSSINCL